MDWGTDGADQKRKDAEIIGTNVHARAWEPGGSAGDFVGSANEPTIKDWLGGSDGTWNIRVGTWKPQLLCL